MSPLGWFITRRLHQGIGVALLFASTTGCSTVMVMPKPDKPDAVVPPVHGKLAPPGPGRGRVVIDVVSPGHQGGWTVQLDDLSPIPCTGPCVVTTRAGVHELTFTRKSKRSADHVLELTADTTRLHVLGGTQAVYRRVPKRLELTPQWIAGFNMSYVSLTVGSLSLFNGLLFTVLGRSNAARGIGYASLAVTGGLAVTFVIGRRIAGRHPAKLYPAASVYFVPGSWRQPSP